MSPLGTSSNISQVVAPDAIRASFAAAMSEMYLREVPAYAALATLADHVNAEASAAAAERPTPHQASKMFSHHRDASHGAIRVGTPDELKVMRRVFAVMGMHPVGYYDLSGAGIPVHATAFRPITCAALEANGFRIFASLLRLDLIGDAELRAQATRVLSARVIFTSRLLELLDTAERNRGLSQSESAEFVAEALETFRWQKSAAVSKELYERLRDTHRVLADIVSFRGPHINHLTPSVLDIDRVQDLMPTLGIAPKETIEGPPRRNCPLLLRQTSFKALEEPIEFVGEGGVVKLGTHLARFGEVEQRGAALTPKGRRLYDQLLGEARSCGTPEADRAQSANASLRAAFAKFPDNWEELRTQRLVYFEYALTEAGAAVAHRCGRVGSLEALLSEGFVHYRPITYEDFLPVSAAGIFRSNLDAQSDERNVAAPSEDEFEAALGAQVVDPFSLYEAVERASIERCFEALHLNEDVA
ncbi:MAG: VOC family protein [Telmatospirillum sp.]|nr:VOC family protein [Telmatospirillum sp.]